MKPLPEPDTYIHRAHRILNRMRVRPTVRLADGDENLYPFLIRRLKVMEMAWSTRRERYERIKRKAVAANLELDAYRTGNKKTYKLQAEALGKDIASAVEVFRKTHKPMTHLGYSMSPILQVVTYLVDRSNQLFAKDSAVEKQSLAEVKSAKAAQMEAEKDAAAARKEQRRVTDVLNAYMHRFGRMETLPEELSEGRVGADFSALAKEADSFPFKRGNPYYLGDYESEELLDEIGKRLGRPPQRCGDVWKIANATYCCSLPRGHTGFHAENLGGLTTHWGVDRG